MWNKAPNHTSLKQSQWCCMHCLSITTASSILQEVSTLSINTSTLYYSTFTNILERWVEQAIHTPVQPCYLKVHWPENVTVWPWCRILPSLSSHMNTGKFCQLHKLQRTVPVAMTTIKKTSPESQMASFMKEAAIKQEVTIQEKAIMCSFFQDGEKLSHALKFHVVICTHVKYFMPFSTCFVSIAHGKTMIKFLWHQVIIMLRQYRRSGNFCVIKFSCFKFSRKNIFVVQDTHENFLTVLCSQV